MATSFSIEHVPGTGKEIYEFIIYTHYGPLQQLYASLCFSPIYK